METHRMHLCSAYFVDRVLWLRGLVISSVFSGGSVNKEFTCSAGKPRDLGSIPGWGRSSGVGNGQPTPVFLPGRFHGQRILADSSPWCCKESVTAEQLNMHMYVVMNITTWFLFIPEEFMYLLPCCWMIRLYPVWGWEWANFWHIMRECMRSKSLQSCPTLREPLDYSLPGSSVHGILQARILDTQFPPAGDILRDWSCVSYVSCIGR